MNIGDERKGDKEIGRKYKTASLPPASISPLLQNLFQKLINIFYRWLKPRIEKAK